MLVNKFCFCCELETGGKIIGWFNIVVSIIGIISWGALVGLYGAVANDPNVNIDGKTATGKLTKLIVE